MDKASHPGSAWRTWQVVTPALLLEHLHSNTQHGTSAAHIGRADQSNVLRIKATTCMHRAALQQLHIVSWSFQHNILWMRHCYDRHSDANFFPLPLLPLLLQVESDKLCQTGLDEEPELQWKADQAAALAPCQAIKHTFARIARECPDVKFFSLSVSATASW
jgi:hypothetical protein